MNSIIKLGKRPARHDPRMLRMTRYLPTDLPAAPLQVDYSAKVVAALSAKGFVSWGMMGNDVLGDCTCAAAGHMIEEWTANAGTIGVISATDVIAAYSAITGYNPNVPASDQGAVEVDVLNYWRQNGIAGHRILGYAALDPRNAEHVKQSLYLFEGCYIGLALPASAQDQDVWDVPAGGPRGDGEPGSWGGHAVNVVAYDSAGLTVVTWGALKRMTWAFWDTYCDEAYAVLSADILADGKCPAGFDLATLQTDLAEVGQLELPIGPQVPVDPPAPDARPRLYIALMTGLNTDPTGTCCGMRALAEQVAALYPEYDVKIAAFGWDQTPPPPFPNSPAGLVDYIRQDITAFAPAKIVMFRHSFGGDLGLFFDQSICDWYSGPQKDSAPFKIDLVVDFDIVQNTVRFGSVPLDHPPQLVENVFCAYQRNGYLLFIKGNPVAVRDGVTNVDVSGWKNPELGHVDFLWLKCLIGDSRVQSMVLAQASPILNEVPA